MQMKQNQAKLMLMSQIRHLSTTHGVQHKMVPFDGEYQMNQ